MNAPNSLLVTAWAILLPLLLTGQKRWTGNGGDGEWDNPFNWTDSTAPIATDNVVLDNTNVSGTYTVNLASTSVTVSINSLKIAPDGSNSITLVIPSSDTASPGLNVTGVVSGSDGIIIDNNGILQNSTGASPGGVGIAVSNKLRINNGGKYIHNNPRAHAAILDKLSSAIGTEYGIWEFDVPGTAGYTVSISDRTYGTLIFSAASSGTARAYTGNAASLNNLTIRGDLIISQQATFKTTQNSDINLWGHLTVNGVFNFSPASNTSPQRSLNFLGTAKQIISGSGNILADSNFNKFDIMASAVVELLRDAPVPLTESSFIVRDGGTLWMNTFKIYGAGTFEIEANGRLGIGSPDGIVLSPAANGNVQTTTRIFDPGAIYEYYGSQGQATGNALPDTLTNNLIIDNASSTGVTLSKATSVTGLLSLTQGSLHTSSSELITLTATGTITSGTHSYTNLPYTNMGNDASFIDGPVKKEGLSDEAFAFPVGKTNMHRPLILKEATGDFIVEYFRSNPQLAYGTALDPSIEVISALEYWVVEASGASPSAKVELTFYDPNSGGVIDINALLVSEWNNFLWDDIGASAVTGTPGTNGSVTSQTITNFLPPFTLASNSSAGAPLDIPVIRFGGVLINHKVRLDWQIGSDIGLSRIEIERSADGIHFGSVHTLYFPKSRLTVVNGFWDNAPLPGPGFYRLKLVQENGTEAKTWVIRVDNEDLTRLSLYPNPAHREIFVNLPTSSSNFEIEIVNTSGQVVKTRKISGTATKINLENLIKGLYFIRLCSDQGIITRKFFKN